MITDAKLTPSLSKAQIIRRPRQKRSRERFETILDSAARLLETSEPHEISIYTIAEDADMSPASIYHFFPDADCVFVALAERYFTAFIEGFHNNPAPPVGDWMDWMDLRFARVVEYYNNNAAPRKILLGSGLSASMRARDLDFDRELAERAAQELISLFEIPNASELIDRITETLVLTDAFWMLSVHRHGKITAELEEQARRARIAFTRTYLPEYLPLRREGAQAQPKPQE